MDRNIITEVASQQGIEFDVLENPATGTITLAFAPITRGVYYDPNTGKARPIAFARHVVRELIKYNGNTLPTGLVGQRGRNEDGSANDEISFTFNVDGGTLPSGWLPKKLRPSKASELVELEAALPALGGPEPLAVKYFNSSTNEGIVVEDERVPFALQFVSDEDGLQAKFLKHSAVGGKKTWVTRDVTVSEAIALVEKALTL